MKNKKISLMLLVLLSLFIFGCGYKIVKKENNNVINSEGDNLISKCKEDYNYYKDISEKKHDSSLSTLEIKKIANLSEAKEFLKLWGSLYDQSSYSNSNFPVVMIAVKSSNRPISDILICDNQGKLIEESKNIMGFL